MNTKEEFLQRLEEDKWFDDPDELIAYRLPVVQYYLDNYESPLNLVINGQRVSTKGIQIVRKPDDFVLINQAFLGLKERINELKLK